MKSNSIIIALFDKRARMVSSLHTVRNAAVAVREFREAVEDPKLADTPLVRHLPDFALVRLGTMDDETGLIRTECSVPVELDVLVDGASLQAELEADR